MKLLSILLISFSALLFVGCGGGETKTPANTNSKNTAAEKPNEEKPAKDNKLATPKDSIAYQFELVKKGDFETLKSCCFTEKAKGSLTKEIVDKAKEDSSKTTMEEIFDKVEEGEADGKKTAKVIMKGGRTLTTLIETDGKWLANTVWFN